MRYGNRRGALGARGLLAIAASVSVVVGFAPAVAQAKAGPKIVVTPSTGLVSGQTVVVKGSGFSPKDEIVGLACPAPADDPESCDLESETEAVADAHGNFTVMMQVHRTLLSSNGIVDCAPAACALLFLGESGEMTTAPVKFDPNVPLPPTTLKVAPATNLADRQALKVTATGFTADPDVYVNQCITGTFACGTAVDVFTKANGSVTTKVPAQRILYDSEGNRVDCAASAGTCSVLVFDANDVDYHATAALEFDPNLPPPPPPSLTVRPSTKLPYYARVTLQGKHWTPGDFILMMECSSDGSACAFLQDFPMVDNNGVLRDQPMLQREITNFFDPGGPAVDCAAPHQQCDLIVQGQSGPGVTVPLSFDPNAPIPSAPSVRVDPAGPYADQQTVTITGKNFAPNASYSVSECIASDDEEGCDIGEAPDRTTATGSLSTQFDISREADPGDPSSDCTKPHVSCTLEVASEGGAVVDVPLTFTGGSTGRPATTSMTASAVTSTVFRSTALAAPRCGESPASVRALLRAGVGPRDLIAACVALRRATNR